MYFALHFDWLKSGTSKRDNSKTLFFPILKFDSSFLKFPNQNWSTWWLDLSICDVPMACIYALFGTWYIKIRRFEIHQTCFLLHFYTVALQKYSIWFLVNIIGSKISLFSAPKTSFFISFLSYNRSFWSLRFFLNEYEINKAFWDSRKTMWGIFQL